MKKVALFIVFILVVSNAPAVATVEIVYDYKMIAYPGDNQLCRSRITGKTVIPEHNSVC